jgi:uroporphyrinogen III methyltransferase/synthase
LRQAGALVEDVPVYRSVVPPEVDAEVLAEIIEGRVDLVTLTSSSTARNFVELLRSRAGEAAWSQAQQKLSFAAIGPITAQTAAELGLNVVVNSAEHTIAGLVEAIRRWASPPSP